jgi:selenocysteine lyase/cysteine desulfurase
MWAALWTGVASRCGPDTTAHSQPLRRLGVETTVWASLAFYNTDDEVHAFGAALRNLTRVVRR